MSGIDVFSQNLIRVSAAAILFLLFGLLLAPESISRALRTWRRFILPAVLVSLAQTFWMAGMLRVGVTFSSLVGRADILLTILVGAVFFTDERHLIVQPGFLPGLLVSLLGVSGVVLFRAGATGEVATSGREFAIGVACISASAIAWVAHVYALKVVVKGMGAAATLVSVTALSCVFTALIWCIVRQMGLVNIMALAEVSAWTLAQIIASGLLGIGGGLFFIRSIELVGATITQSGILAFPLSVGILAFFWLGEMLSAGQLLSGALLLAGLGVIMYVGYKARVALPPAGVA